MRVYRARFLARIYGVIVVFIVWFGAIVIAWEIVERAQRGLQIGLLGYFQLLLAGWWLIGGVKQILGVVPRLEVDQSEVRHFNSTSSKKWQFSKIDRVERLGNKKLKIYLLGDLKSVPWYRFAQRSNSDRTINVWMLETDAVMALADIEDRVAEQRHLVQSPYPRGQIL